MAEYELVLIFFFVALFYSMVGFGGGSSYLAIMAIYGVSAMEMKTIALLCNIVVVTGGTYLFYKRGLLSLRKLIPLVVLSVPLAFIGGLLRTGDKIFLLVLGASLVLAAVLMGMEVLKGKNEEGGWKKDNKALNIGLGGGVGLLSGFVGIGGGIFLSPILHFTRWGHVKQIAAAASFFILVNSLAGLTGHVLRSGLDFRGETILPLVLAVFIGGQVGSRITTRYFNQRVVKALTALLILYVGIRLILLQVFGIQI